MWAQGQGVGGRGGSMATITSDSTPESDSIQTSLAISVMEEVIFRGSLFIRGWGHVGVWWGRESKATITSKNEVPYSRKQKHVSVNDTQYY